ncbi:conserved hypothetical protein [Trichinella spiralis]|uniref:hypothetical protein n=1 Tax=Trichinella spiralis TaxID=6334 RepID=UPI0001EFE95A|nr:conserved hypothetical protein [Trichinella spiralis]
MLLSDPCNEPLLLYNYCVHGAIRTKAWAANERQIHALCLLMKIISNDCITAEHIQLQRTPFQKLLPLLSPEAMLITADSINKEGCEGAIWRNQDVTAVLTQKDRIKRCRADEHLAHKTEKAVRKKKC